VLRRLKERPQRSRRSLQLISPRASITSFLVGGIVLVYACLTGSAQTSTSAQQPAAVSETRARGIRLFEQGDFKGALEALRAAVKENRADADAWYVLGLTLYRQGAAKDARRAFETATRLRPDFVAARTAWAFMLLLGNKNGDAAREAGKALEGSFAPNFEAQYVLAVVHSRAGEFGKALERVEASLAAKADYPPALLLKSQLLMTLFTREADASNPEPAAVRYGHLKGAAESLDKYLRLTPKAKDAAFWREQLEGLRAYANLRDPNKPETEETIYAPRETTTKAHLLSRANPTYTDEARQAQVSGTVILKAVLAADGTVRHILVVQSLSHGLTERAVEAARRIKFIPAVKDGRPVSQFVQIEYNFNLY
jgi:TonB family protein